MILLKMIFFKLIFNIFLIIFTFFSFAQNQKPMDLNHPEMKESFQIVESLMQLSQIPIRDTWKGIEGYNYDDYFINKSYNGKKHFQLIIKNDGITDTEGTKYEIPGFKCVAYNNFKIRIPKRLVGLRHNIIHEIVHFLQENNSTDDNNYISFNGNNYLQYFSQKSEIEAHFIQILYIEKYENKKLQLNENDFKEFQSKIEKAFENKEKKIELILFSKSHGII